MKKLIIIILLFSSISNRAQNYLEYHRQVYNAERYIEKKDYSKALDLYLQIFSSYSNALHEDLNNAFYAAVLSENESAMLSLFKKLVQKGYTLQDFGNFKSIPPKILEQCKTAYNELRQAYLSGLNYERRNAINEIFLKDQHNASLGGKFGEAADTVWYKHAKILSEDYLQNGFPPFLTTKDSMQMRYLVVLRHYFGMLNTVSYDNALLVHPRYEAMDFESLDWKNKLESGIQKGKLSPASYKLVVEYRDWSRPFGGLAVEVDFNTETVKPIFTVHESKKQRINTYRKKYGLPPIPSSDINISATWYSQYPFQKVREALKNCKTCKNGLDSVKLKGRIEDEVEKAFKKKSTNVEGFKLRASVDINEVHYTKVR